jgi:stage V sporulation protein B
MKEESLTTSLVKNSFWNFLTTLLSRIGGFIFVIIIARFLLPEKFGIYNLAMSIMIILFTIADAGINQTLIRYFSEAINKKDKKSALKIYRYLLKLKFSLTLLFSLLLIIFSYPLSYFIFNKPALFLPLIFSSAYLFVASFESFYESFFYIEKKVKYLATKQIIFESLRILGVLLLFSLIAKQYPVIGVIGVLIIALCFALAYVLFNLKKITPPIFKNPREKLDKSNKKRINSFLYYLMIGSTLVIIFGYIDTIMIGLFLPSAFIGFYSVSLSLVMGFAALLSVANVLLPIFTKLKKEKINDAFNKVFKYTAMFAIPMIFGFFILGNYIISTIWGYEYLPATLPLYFLAFLILEIPVTNALYSLFSAREKPKYLVNILIISTIINIVLNYILITSFLKISMDWAIAGAAIATLISQYFYFAGLYFFAKKKLKVSLNSQYLIKPLISSITMAAILFLINTFIIKDMNLIIGLGEVALGVLLYFLIMFLIKGVEKQDFYLIKEIVK